MTKADSSSGGLHLHSNKAKYLKLRTCSLEVIRGLLVGERTLVLVGEGLEERCMVGINLKKAFGNHKG